MQLDAWQIFAIFVSVLILLMQVLLCGYYFQKVMSCGPGNTRHNWTILLFHGIISPLKTLMNDYYIINFMYQLLYVHERARQVPAYEFFQWLRFFVICCGA
jgi:hypothetical protein